MSIKKVYKCHIKGSSYVFKSGKKVSFLGGVYITDIEEEITELEKEIAGGIPHIYIDAKQTEIDTSKDPEEAYKEKIIAEWQAEQAAIKAKQASHSTVIPAAVQGPVGGANSLGVAQAMGGSISMEAAPAAAPATVKAPK